MDVNKKYTNCECPLLWLLLFVMPILPKIEYYKVTVEIVPVYNVNLTEPHYVTVIQARRIYFLTHSCYGTRDTSNKEKPSNDIDVGTVTAYSQANVSKGVLRRKVGVSYSKVGVSSVRLQLGPSMWSCFSWNPLCACVVSASCFIKFFFPGENGCLSHLNLCSKDYKSLKQPAQIAVPLQDMVMDVRA